MTDLEWTDDFATVTWRRADETREFTFSAQQREVVRLLIENRGRAQSQRWILERIGSSSSRLRDVFKSRNGMHPAWKTLIETFTEHGLAKDLFRVPRENPSPSPDGPPAISDSSPSGAPMQAPTTGGEMVSRLPEDSESWLEGQIAALCSDLIAERNFTRVLLRWGAIEQRASKQEIRRIADRFEAENLVAGIHYVVETALQSNASLSLVEKELRGLAAAWGPERSPAGCLAPFSPGGSYELLHAAGLIARWITDGDADALGEATCFIPGAPYDTADLDPDAVLRLIVEALRRVSAVDGGAIARQMAEAAEARDADFLLGIGPIWLNDSILDEVWAL